MKFNLFMCILKKILLTLWLSYLQAHIQKSCMYLSCKILTEITVAEDKTINTNMTKWRYSQLIFTEKYVYQQCTSYASAVRKSVGNAFSGSLET